MRRGPPHCFCRERLDDLVSLIFLQFQTLLVLVLGECEFRTIRHEQVPSRHLDVLPRVAQDT